VTGYPAPLAAHLANEVTTVCNCWRVVREDGVTLGFTDHDRPLIVDGTLCRPETGLTASEARRTLGLGADTIDIEGALNSGDIDGADVAAGKFDGALVESLLVNWREPAEFARLRTSTIAKLVLKDGRFVAELQSRMRALDQPNGRHVQRQCDAELGDSRCKVLLADPSFTGAGSVLSLTRPAIVSVAGLAGFDPGWFTHGWLTWTSGPRSGQRDLVLSHRRQSGEDRLTLRQDDLPDAEIGDSFGIVAGCDKHFATCRAKFANAANFRGFPHLPGNDEAYSYVTDTGVFDGGPLVP